MEHCEINGAEVSRIGLSTRAFRAMERDKISEGDAICICVAALEQGIHLIDISSDCDHCAGQERAGQGHAERLVGAAVAQHGCREDFYIAAQCRLDGHSVAALADSAPQRIERELADSLARLHTSYVDLYLVHAPTSPASIEQIAEWMARLLHEGRIRAIGVSNFSVAQMDRFRAVAPIHAAQLPYNLFERAIDRDLLPYCELYGIPLLTGSPLCRGLLGGQLTAATAFPPTDIRFRDPKFRLPHVTQYLAAVERLQAFAAQHYGKSVAELAVRWVLDRPGVSATLYSAKRPKQLTLAAACMGWHLDGRARGFIEEIVRQTVTDTAEPAWQPSGGTERGSPDQTAGSMP